jgi:hypothetical protein
VTCSFLGFNHMSYEQRIAEIATDMPPGTYLFANGKIKSMSLDRQLIDLISGGDSQASRLVATVPYVFIALNRRKSKTMEVPYRWRVNDNEVDNPPFKFDWHKLAPRIDEALQLSGVAYLLKQRNGRKFIGVRWLDPTTIEPDETSIDAMKGYTRYIRTNQANGQQTTIKAEDLIVFMLPGQSELDPPPSAAQATSLAAQILYGIAVTADGAYDNGGLPVYMINVPAATSDTDKARLEGYFSRIFNRRKGATSRREYRTIAVREGITVQQLSLKPADLAMPELEKAQIQAILSAYEVPYTLVMAESANYATANIVEKQFTQAVGSRLEYLATLINEDADIMAYGAELAILLEQHPSMQVDEASRSVAGLRYVEMGMTPEAAGFLIGINVDDFPEGMVIWQEQAPMIIEQPQAPQTPPSELMQEPSAIDDMTIEAKLAKADEERKFRKWYKSRKGQVPIEEFKRVVLKLEDLRAIVEEDGEPYIDPDRRIYMDTLKAVIDDINSRKQQDAQRPLTISPVINITERDVTVQPANVEYKAEAPNIYVTMPEQPAPVVTVNVPEQPAPVVNVESPAVTVENTVEFPSRARELTTVQRDREGRIETARTTTEFE